MVPVYSITSWFSLFVPNSIAQLLGTIRDCYEAYAVYSFIGFLIAVVADGKGHDVVETMLEHRIVRHLAEKEAQTHSSNAQHYQFDANSLHCGKLNVVEVDGDESKNIELTSKDNKSSSSTNKTGSTSKPLKAPCPCFVSSNASPKKIAATILDQCIFMAMQFVFLKVVLAFVPVVWTYKCDPSYDIENKRSIDWECPQTYVMIIANISVALAFYGLLCFYHLMEKELKNACDPWPKFLCVKGVVFMTFWQGVLLQIVSSLGFLDSKSAMQIQNLLICIEMFMASIAHFYIFPYQEWQPGYEKISVNFQEALALPGLATDLHRISRRRDFSEVKVEDSTEDKGEHHHSRVLSRTSSKEEVEHLDINTHMQSYGATDDVHESLSPSHTHSSNSSLTAQSQEWADIDMRAGRMVSESPASHLSKMDSSISTHDSIVMLDSRSRESGEIVEQLNDIESV
jgi:hypothetical protein